MLSLMYEFAIAAQVPTSVVSVQAFRWGGRKESVSHLLLRLYHQTGQSAYWLDLRQGPRAVVGRVERLQIL